MYTTKYIKYEPVTPSPYRCTKHIQGLITAKRMLIQLK